MNMEIEDLANKLSQWVDAGIIDSEQARSILSREDPSNALEHPTPTHRDLSTLFSELREFLAAHPTATVIKSDEPMWGFLGWTAYFVEETGETSRSFTIRLVDAKNSSDGCTPPTVQISESNKLVYSFLT
jgi:hypothetical protein